MAACAQCGSAVPRGAAACPQCGTAVVRVAKRAPARPAAAKVAPAVRPVVKAVAEPVAPRVKGGATPTRATPKVTPKAPKAAKPAAKSAKAAKVAAPARKAAKPAAAAERPAAVARESAVPAESAERAEQRAAWSAAYDAAPTAAPVGGGAAVRPEPPSFRRGASGDVIGEADERHADDPVAAEAGPRQPLPAPFEVVYEPADRRAGWPLVLRVVRGDWRPALRAALPAIAATVVVAAVAAASLFLATKPEGDDLLVGDVSAGRWLRYVCVAVGLAFGGPLSVTQERGGEVFEGLGRDLPEVGYAVRFVPLTVTLLSLAALWYSARRAHERNVTPERFPDALRTAAVFAAGVGLVSWLGRWETVSEEGSGLDGPGFTITNVFAMAPWRPMFWAFCLALLVAWVATGQLVVAGRWAGWLLAARGALVGLGAGVAASFLLLVVLGIAYADRAGGDATDVMNAIPLALAYGVGGAAAAFGVLSGGQVVVPGRGQTDWSLLSPWLPKPFLVLLVVPALAVALAAYYLLKRSGAPREEALRACDRMWLPAGVAWLLVCAAGSPHLSQSSGFGFSSQITAGPVLWGALLVALWFGAGGWVAGRVLDRRLAPVPVPDAPVDPPGDDT